jgi:hypothetical protein
MWGPGVEGMVAGYLGYAACSPIGVVVPAQCSILFFYSTLKALYRDVEPGRRGLSVGDKQTRGAT